MPRVLAMEFPRARYNRAAQGATSFSEAAGFTMPQVRLWAFHMRQGANKRATVASPALHGPAVIRDLLISTPTGINTGVLPLIQVFKSPSAGPVGNGLALTNTPNGLNIFDSTVSLDGQMTNPGLPGIYDLVGAVSRAYMYRPLNIVIEDDLFFLNVSVHNNNAGALEIEGSIRIYERVDPLLVGSLLGA